MEGIGPNPRVSFLGCGNVAYHLAPALAKAGAIVEVWSRNIDHSREVASRDRFIKYIESLDNLNTNSDFYIITVSDYAIPEIAEKVASLNVNGVVAHTSGSFPLEKLSEIVKSERTGVFYPLQTFSKTTELEIDKVPLFIEGSSKPVTAELINLASLISSNVQEADSTVRGHLHVAAVFANNFVNSIWAIADNYLKRNLGKDIRVFEPLLYETLRKAMTAGPIESQTGPAKRGDEKTMEEQLKKLLPEEAEIYKLISSNILRQTQNEQN